MDGSVGQTEVGSVMDALETRAASRGLAQRDGIVPGCRLRGPALPGDRHQSGCNDGVVFGQNAGGVAECAQVDRRGYNLAVVHLWGCRRCQRLLKHFPIQRVNLQTWICQHCLE